jgi:hypothetical protein
MDSLASKLSKVGWGGAAFKSTLRAQFFVFSEEIDGDRLIEGFVARSTNVKPSLDELTWFGG